MNLKTINRIRISLIVGFVLLAFWGLILDFQYPNGDSWILINSEFGRFLAHVLIGLGPEIAGIAIGIISIDYFNEKRQNQSAQIQLKSKLIRELRSKVKDVALNAVEELQEHGWVIDGSLMGVNLTDANLEGANLRNANLNQSTMIGCILNESNLYRSSLQNVDLTLGSLQNAILPRVDLFFATLNSCKFKHARMRRVNFQNTACKATNFIETDLQGSNFQQALLLGANFAGADLQWADFDSANITLAKFDGANMKNARNLTHGQIFQAKSLKGAIMPDGNIFEMWLEIQNLKEDWDSRINSISDLEEE
ncbi:MAG: pentapeptide repeat-containing protein [Chloroflexota bacterium]